MQITKRYFLSIFLLFLGGCSANGLQNFGCTESLPQENMVGVYQAIGMGSDKLEAITNAREQLSMQLHADLSMRCTDFVSTDANENKQECNSTLTSKAVIVDDEILQTNTCGPYTQVLLKLDTRPLAQRIIWSTNELKELGLNEREAKQRTKIPFTFFGNEESDSPLQISYDPLTQLWTITYQQQKFILTSENLWRQIDWNICESPNSMQISQYSVPNQIIETGHEMTLTLLPKNEPYHVLVFNIYYGNVISAITKQSIPVSDQVIELTFFPLLLPNQRQSEEAAVILSFNQPTQAASFNSLGADDRLLELVRRNTSNLRSSVCSLTYKQIRN